MFIKLFSGFLIWVLSFFNIILLSTPIVLVFIAILGFREAVIFQQQILLIVVTIASLATFAIICFLFLNFSFGLKYKTRLSNFVHYKETKYAPVIEIIVGEISKQLGLGEGELEIYTVPDSRRRIYSFDYKNGGIVVLTIAMMDYLVEEIKKDSSKVLFGFQGMLVHEFSHIKNRDNLIGEFVKMNSDFTEEVLVLISGFFKIALYAITFVPISIIKQLFSVLSSRIGSIIRIVLPPFNFLMEKVYEILKRTLFQIQEKRCDADVKRVIGPSGLPSMCEVFGQYNNFFSCHTTPVDKRVLRTSNVLYEENKQSNVSGGRDNALICIAIMGIFPIATFVIFYHFYGVSLSDFIIHLEASVLAIYSTMKGYIDYGIGVFYAIKKLLF